MGYKGTGMTLTARRSIKMSRTSAVYANLQLPASPQQEAIALALAVAVTAAAVAEHVKADMVKVH